MQYDDNLELSEQYSRGLQTAEAKGSFIAKVYTKLTFSVLALAAIEALVFMFLGAENILYFTQTHIQAMGIGLLVLCIGGPFVANMILARSPSRSTQYGVLVFYILLEAAILFPILAVAGLYFGPGLIWQACGLTAALFIALSAAVFVTRVDFSFLRALLLFVGIAAIVLIAASLIFGFNLGMWFTIAMIVFACGYILYDTSNMALYASPEDDILCTISLFTSVMMLFFYILRLLMSLNRN